MRAVVATALFLWALLAVVIAGTAGATARTEAEAKLVDRLQGLQNISQAELGHLKDAIIHIAEQASQEVLEFFKKTLTIDESEREALDALISERAAGGDGAAGYSINIGGGGSGGGDSNETLQETIRRIIEEGLPSQGIPPLDPFEISKLPTIDIDIPESLQLKADLSELSVDGIGGFQDDVTVGYDIKLSQFAVNVDALFDVLIPRIHVFTLYQADGSVDAGLDIFGEGPININIYRLRVKGDVVVRGSLFGGVKANPCDISVSSRSMDLKIEGLFGGGLLSELAGEIVTEMINEYVWKILFDTISTVINDGVCNYINGLSIYDAIALLLKITSAPYPA